MESVLRVASIAVVVAFSFIQVAFTVRIILWISSPHPTTNPLPLTAHLLPSNERKKDSPQLCSLSSRKLIFLKVVLSCMLVLGKRLNRWGHIFRKIKVVSESKETQKYASGTMWFPQNICTSLDLKWFSVFAAWISAYVEKTRYYHNCFGFICSLANYQCFSDQTNEFLVSGMSYSVVLCSPAV